MQQDQKIRYKELHEICDIHIGKKINKYENKLYGGSNLLVTETDLATPYNKIYNTSYNISNDIVNQYNFMLIPQNTVLFTCNLSISKIAISGKPVYTNDKVAGLIIKNREELLTEYLYCALCFYNKLTINCYIHKLKDNSLNIKILSKIKLPIVSIEKQKKIILFLNNLYLDKLSKNIKTVIDYYVNYDFDIFDILLNENYEMYNCLDLIQKFNIKIFKLTDIIIIKDELLNLQKIKNDITTKINDNNLIDEPVK